MVAIRTESPHYKNFLSLGITKFDKAAQLQPKKQSTDASKETYSTEHFIKGSNSNPTENTPTMEQTVAQMERDRANRLASFLASSNKFLTSQGLPMVESMSEAMVGIQKVGNMPLDSSPLEATTGSNVKVSVKHSWVYPEGAENDISQAERGFHVTLSRDGKEIQSFSLKKDVRITELEDGTFEIVELQDGQTHLEGTDRDDIIISQFASHVSAGAGNDVVFALNDGVYDGGDGDDTFILGGERRNITVENGAEQHGYVNGENATIKGGSGNDTVIGSRIIGAKIDLGEGDNVVYSDGLIVDSTILAGSGNNNLFASGLRDSNIGFGEGANTIGLRWVTNSALRLGHGGNDIYINMVNDEGSTSISSGSGDDRLHIGFFNDSRHLNVHLGGGNNTASSRFNERLADIMADSNYTFGDKNTLQKDIHEQYTRIRANFYV